MLLELKAVHSNQKGFLRQGMCSPGQQLYHRPLQLRHAGMHCESRYPHHHATRAMGPQQHDTAARPRVFGTVLQ